MACYNMLIKLVHLQDKVRSDVGSVLEGQIGLWRSTATEQGNYFYRHTPELASYAYEK